MFFTDELRDLEDYESQKQYFELFVYKERVNGLFIFQCNNKIELIRKQTLVGALYDIKTDDDESFIKRWLTDDTINAVDDMCFHPVGVRESFDRTFRDGYGRLIFNLFSGWADIPHIHMSQSECDIILRPWMNIGLALCEDNVKLFDLLLDHLANIIQYPRNRSTHCWAFVNSPQGAGKDVFFGAFGRLLGTHYINSADPRAFFGDYAEGFVNKLCVVMNEVDNDMTTRRESQLKDLITGNMLDVRMMYCRPTRIPNFGNFFIFSNKVQQTMFDADSGDRRYICATPAARVKYAYGGTSWAELDNKVFRSEQFVSALFNFLASRNIDGVNWSRRRKECLTGTYWRIFENSLHPIPRFIKKHIHLLESDQIHGHFMDRYEMITKCSDKSYAIRINSLSFCRLVQVMQMEVGERVEELYMLSNYISVKFHEVITILEHRGVVYYFLNTKKLYNFVLQTWYPHKCTSTTTNDTLSDDVLQALSLIC